VILGVQKIDLSGIGGRCLDWAYGTASGDRWEADNCLLRGASLSPMSGQRRPVAAPGLSHICIQSKELADALAVATAAGFEALSEPTDLGTGYRYLYAHAPGGMLVEMEGAPFAPDGMPAFWVGHIAWCARDGARLAGFYAALTGRDVTPPSRLRGNRLFDQVTGLADVDLEGRWIPGLNIGLEFWQFHNPGSEVAWQGAGPVCVTFESDAPESDAERAVALGATPVEEAGPTSLRDPEGNRFDLASPGGVARLRAPDLIETLNAHHPARRA
jgi:hypothetical protein